MIPSLRPWQSEALQRFISTKGDFLAVATPGAGKTRLAAMAAADLLNSGLIRRVIVVVPTASLREQWGHVVAEFGIQLDHRYANGTGPLAPDFQGVAATYAQVATQSTLWRKLCTDRETLVILDEIHHAGYDRQWGAAIRDAFSPAYRRLLLSGTPFRTDGAALPFVRYEQDWCVPDYSYDYAKALRDHVVRPVEFPVLDGEARWCEPSGVVVSVDLTNTDEQTRSNAFASAYDPAGQWIGSVLRFADQQLTRHRLDVPDAAGLVIAHRQDLAVQYAKILQEISGEPVTVAVSDLPDATARIDEFRRGASRWLVAVQMVSEGVDIPRLAVGVYASRILTELFFQQVVGRFVRMRTADDETTATLVIPAIEPLVRMAASIDQIVAGALTERVETAEREAKEFVGQLEFNLSIPLPSGEALHTETIISGDSISQAELARAEALGRVAGMPGSVTPAAIAKLLRISGSEPVVGKVTIEPPLPPQRSLADEKKELRTVLKRLVGRYARQSEMDYMDIHFQLNKMCGDTVPTATADNLRRRVTLLEQWLDWP